MGTRFPGVELACTVTSNASRSQGDVLKDKGPRASYHADTMLQLDSVGCSIRHVPTAKGIKRKWSWISASIEQRADPSLSLGLGYSSSSSDSKGSSATACSGISSAKETEEESSMDLDLDFKLHLGNDNSPSTMKSARINKFVAPQAEVVLELSLSTGPSESAITSLHSEFSAMQNGINFPPATRETIFLDDEAALSHCILPCGSTLYKQTSEKFNLVGFVPDLPEKIARKPESLITSGIVQQQARCSSSKLCKFTGCEKGAKGASGLCIGHGGGRRCQKAGCHKGAEGRTAFCKAHGGGRRCGFLGCRKNAEGHTDFCIGHGGGRRCSNESCTRAARGKSGLCIRHGGGKRCQIENCTRSAEGLSGLCISHGGGRRCQYPTCTKGAQGSTMFCKAHGGGKRCTVEGCGKGAEGSTPFCKGHGGGKRCSFPGCPKSVHGGTSFCVAHGGGKRCAVPDCTKSARGRTDFCVRHGGGKRCKFEGCGRSAQGNTDFCKAHGGGKRCSWGQPGSQYDTSVDGPCSSLARGKIGLCTMHRALVQDKRVHGGVTLVPRVQDPKSQNPDNNQPLLSVDANAESIHIGDLAGYNKDQMRLTPATKGSAEGRVHGGSLMAMLENGTGFVSSNGLTCESPQPSYTDMMLQ